MCFGDAGRRVGEPTDTSSTLDIGWQLMQPGVYKYSLSDVCLGHSVSCDEADSGGLDAPFGTPSPSRQATNVVGSGPMRPPGGVTGVSAGVAAVSTQRAEMRGWWTAQR